MLYRSQTTHLQHYPGFPYPKSCKCVNALLVGYAIGFARNQVLERKIADLLERARLQFLHSSAKGSLGAMMFTMPLPVGHIPVVW